MTADDTVETTGSTRDGDRDPHVDTEGVRPDTEGADGTDTPTEVLVGGAADAAVRGVDEVLGREVRLVTLPPATGDALSDRIEQVRHLARLHHPHLLEVYDVDGLAPDTESTLVLESVAGEPLPVVLREGPLPAADLARMGAQLASALAHAHAHHVEHGAIGPASILVNRAGAEAWLVGLTASLSGPLPVVSETSDAPARRAADVRALARTLADVVGLAPDGDGDAERLLALLRDADTDLPPSAAALSERLVRLGRDDTPVTDETAAARLVPVVASWSESPVTPGDTGPTVGAAVAVGPAVRAHGLSGVTPFAVVPGPGRRARRAGVLAAATATLALASGLVIWAGESQVVRQIPQAEVGPSLAIPAAVPGFPAFGPALPASDDGGSGSSEASDDDAGPWTRAAETSTRTPDEAPAPEETTTPGTTTPAEPVPSSDPTRPTDPTDPTDPDGPPSTTPSTTPPTRPTTTTPTVPPTSSTTVPGTTMPGTPSTGPGSTTTAPGSTTSAPGTPTGPGTGPTPPVGGTPPVAPTTTTTVTPVPAQANALLAFGTF
ncbi:hypothetical protein [Actinomycetospora soli]|uniref:hypothetical protein n=1 Tax=Actinomycetospora soli TaxID=2893887 RepID=UPI001E4587C5|nr:hypothetical protein [Actinomycetospora soli]MCD2187081.1 hypothetical protein [Actinomycetospora soli]